MSNDFQNVDLIKNAFTRLKNELAKVIVGQDQVIEELLIAIFSRGHCILEGVPGLAKTLIVSTLSSAMDLSFSRIQFTPDLMPADITGTEVLQEDPETGRRKFEFQRGPIFTNLLLADEINRTPPKTQAALLQAMQENHVTAGNRTFELPEPFFVLATQNPIEQEGTYPLPEAQLDRFMFMVQVGYPSLDDELEIYRRTSQQSQIKIDRVMDSATLINLQKLVKGVPIGEEAITFAASLIRATRPNESGSSDFVRHWLSWGAGPRAGQYLVTAAKARALMSGRVHVAIDDLIAIARPILRHRIVPSFNAEAEGVTVDQIIERIISLIPVGPGLRLL